MEADAKSGPDVNLTDDGQPEQPGGRRADKMSEDAEAMGTNGEHQTPEGLYQPFERAFPTFYGTEVTRAFRPALERAIERERAKRERQAQK
jgi:hypothetical protein